MTCYGHTCRLPQGDLTYVAFRLSLLDTIQELWMSQDFKEDADEVTGFLFHVPILEGVPPDIQIDLLAEVWARQRKRRLIEANLLDAAIVYAACEEAARIVEDEPEIAEAYLKGGPRRLMFKAGRRLAARFELLFDGFWDDIDFLSLSDLQDVRPADAAELKAALRFIDDRPIYQALERGRLSSQLESNLRGLLTLPEISEVVGLLGVSRP